MRPRVWIIGWQRGVGQNGKGASDIGHYLWACTSNGNLTLDDPAVRAAAAGDPHGFVRSLGNEAVVLDEFQEVPGLVPAIKEASDLHGGVSPDGPVPGGPRKGLFLLTGSADLFRSARAQEALPGHMARLELLPLSLAEIVRASHSTGGP